MPLKIPIIAVKKVMATVRLRILRPSFSSIEIMIAPRIGPKDMLAIERTSILINIGKSDVEIKTVAKRAIVQHTIKLVSK